MSVAGRRCTAPILPAFTVSHQTCPANVHSSTMPRILDGSVTTGRLFDILVVGKPCNEGSVLLRQYLGITRELPNIDSSNCLVSKTVLIKSPDGPRSHNLTILDSCCGVDSLLTVSSYQVTNARTMLFTYSVDSAESLEMLEYTISGIQLIRATLPPCAVVAVTQTSSAMEQLVPQQGRDLAARCGADFFEVNMVDDRAVAAVFEHLILAAESLAQSSDEVASLKSQLSSGSVASEPDSPELKKTRSPPKASRTSTITFQSVLSPRSRRSGTASSLHRKITRCSDKLNESLAVVTRSSSERTVVRTLTAKKHFLESMQRTHSAPLGTRSPPVSLQHSSPSLDKPDSSDHDFADSLSPTLFAADQNQAAKCDNPEKTKDVAARRESKAANGCCVIV